ALVRAGPVREAVARDRDAGVEASRRRELARRAGARVEPAQLPALDDRDRAVAGHDVAASDRRVDGAIPRAVAGRGVVRGDARRLRIALADVETTSVNEDDEEFPVARERDDLRRARLLLHRVQTHAGEEELVRVDLPDALVRRRFREFEPAAP